MSSNRPSNGSITLAESEKVASAALAHGRELGLPPLTVAVLDSGGHLVVLKREDRSSLLRPQIAQAKAYGALAMGMGSRGLAERAASHPAFIAAVGTLAGGNLIPVPGGVLILDSAGVLLGAIGISGALPDQDEACALHGLAAADLRGQSGAPNH